MGRFSVNMRMLVSLAVAIQWSAGSAYAQVLPGSADPSRIQQNTAPATPVPTKPAILAPAEEEKFELNLPQVADGFVLKSIRVTGNSVLNNALFDDVFKDSIGTKVNLQSLRVLANRATMIYRNNGYFLSRVLVPAQDFKDGNVTFVAVEGYVSDVVMRFEKATPAQSAQADAILAEVKPSILALKPLQSTKLQDILLRLNTLGGVAVGSVIEPLPAAQAKPGAVRLAIVIQKTAPAFSVGVDNYGSRFSGPVQSRASAQLNPNLIAFDRLSVSALTSIPTDEVKFLSVGYEAPINYRGTFVGANAGFSKAKPGYTLRPNRIESDSFSFEPYIRHPWIKNREYSATSQLSLDYRNTQSDTLGTELFTDRTRAVRLSNDFSYNDPWQGMNYLNLRFSQGLNILDSSKTGDTNLSRAQGRSDFTKFDGTFSRLQQLTDTLQLYAAVSGQYSDKPLLSSEEFGYGGQSYGRAYDPSELLGDSGIAAGAELRYFGIDPIMNVSVSPFAFYDIGRVWNRDAGSTDDSASSAGLGVRLSHPAGINATLGAAVPLTRDVSTPIFGNNPSNPRLLLELQYGF